MNLPATLLGAAAWFAIPLAAQAQMSTFPAPPPLPGTAESAPSGATANSTGAAAGDNAAAPGKGSGSSAPPTAPAITAGSINTMEALDDKIPLQDGDTVSIRVIEDRDDPVQRLVTDTGDIDFPYIGPVKVEGKTCHQVAVEVKKLLEVDYYKQATVIIGLDRIIGQEDDTKPKDFAWVMGEVRQVGPLELLKEQPMTVSQMIMRAGGFSDFADQRRVKLRHQSGNSATSSGAGPEADKGFQIIDVKSIFDGKAGTDPVVKPGDYIIVPKKIFNTGDLMVVSRKIFNT
jgi:protein involved in polysaccharide export with SLBB domain